MLAASRHIGEAELAILPSLARRDAVSLDVGANWGMYTGALLPLSRRVIAFEPNPNMARVLARSWRRATVHRVALGAREGTETLSMPLMANGAASTGFGTLTPIGAQCETVQVQVCTLDSMLLSHVGFIKIDVEGFEMQVLDGAMVTINRERPNMLIEAANGEAASALVSRLAGLGYGASFLHEKRLRPFAEWRPTLRTRFGIPPFNFVFRPIIASRTAC